MPEIANGVRLKERYRLDRLLGRGGMASVWLATDEVLERPVAIKVLSDTIASDPEFIARFRREAQIAAGLSHPNLIDIYDYAESEERPYLAMEYVEGDNLAERAARGEEVDPERLARELLGALDHIHRAGILHRDVKAQNVLLAPDDSVKLIDFGIALPRDATSLTQTGTLLGTARYAAPEVMNGQPATERSDLYSCGVVLRDCQTGPLPRHLAELVERLTSPEPGRRPASAREALARLERAPIADEPTERMSVLSEPRQADPARRQVGSSRPRWAGAAALGVALIGAVATGLLMLGGADEQPGGGPGSGQLVKAAAGESNDADFKSADEDIEPSTPPPESANTGVEPAASPPEPGGSDDAAGSALNEQGFALIQAGEAEAAVPVLEEAVEAFTPGTEDLDYAYALFNLGNALRLSGRPDEAIPILEQRLEIPNQTSAVQQELDLARSEAG